MQSTDDNNRVPRVMTDWRSFEERAFGGDHEGYEQEMEKWSTEDREKHKRGNYSPDQIGAASNSNTANSASSRMDQMPATPNISGGQDKYYDKVLRRGSSNRRPSFGLASSQSSSRKMIDPAIPHLSTSEQSIQSERETGKRDGIDRHNFDRGNVDIDEIGSRRHGLYSPSRRSLLNNNAKPAPNCVPHCSSYRMGESAVSISKEEEIEAKRRGQQIGSTKRRSRVKHYYNGNGSDDGSIPKLDIPASSIRRQDRLFRGSGLKRAYLSSDDEGDTDALTRASGSLSQDDEIEAKRRGLRRPVSNYELRASRRRAYKSCSSDDDDEILRRSSMRKSRKPSGGKLPGAEAVRSSKDHRLEAQAKSLSYSYFTADDEAAQQRKPTHVSKRLASLASNDTDSRTIDSIPSTRSSVTGARWDRMTGMEEVELELRRSAKVRVASVDSTHNTSRNNSIASLQNTSITSGSNSRHNREDTTQPLNLGDGQLNQSDFDEWGRLLPGAIAVYGEQYQDDDDYEDFVNPDNFSRQEREQNQLVEPNLRQMGQRGGAEQDWSHLQRLRKPPTNRSSRSSFVSVRILDGSSRTWQNTMDAQCQPYNDEEFNAPDIAKMNKNGSACPVASCFLCLIALAVGLTVGLQRNNEFAMPSTLAPVPTVTPSLSPTATQPSMVPSTSLEPSRKATLSPTSLPWVQHATIPGESIGESVGMAGDVIAATTANGVQTFELVDGSWVDSAQRLPGNMVVLGLSRENQPLMAVRDGSSVSVYRRDGENWVIVGDPIAADDFLLTAFALAGRSETLVIGGLQGPTIIARVLDFDRGKWTQRGSDFSKTTDHGTQVQVAISEDGETIAVGADDNFNGYAHVVSLDEDLRWVSLKPDRNFFVGGPSVGLSADGSTIVCGSTSFIQIYDTYTGDQIGEELQVPTLASVSVSMDGRVVAFAYSDIIEVQQLVGESVWRPRGQISSFGYTGLFGSISSISLSPDASRVVIGRPEAGVIQVSEQSKEKT